jgi:hypothetical protein
LDFGFSILGRLRQRHLPSSGRLADAPGAMVADVWLLVTAAMLIVVAPRAHVANKECGRHFQAT